MKSIWPIDRGEDCAISSIEGLRGKDGVWEEDRMANVMERLEELQGARCRKGWCLRCPEGASEDWARNSREGSFEYIPSRELEGS